MRATLPLIRDSDFPAIKRKQLGTLQVNLGYRCNQSRVHCQVNAGPTRTAMMTLETTHDALAFMHASHIGRLDITGDAPELNPHFRGVVRAVGSASVAHRLRRIPRHRRSEPMRRRPRRAAACDVLSAH